MDPGGGEAWRNGSSRSHPIPPAGESGSPIRLSVISRMGGPIPPAGE